MLPGSGRGSVERALGRCDVLITGDLGYHDSELASERGMALIDAPHGDLEWWAFKRWCETLSAELASRALLWRYLTSGAARGSGWRSRAMGRGGLVE